LLFILLIRWGENNGKMNVNILTYGNLCMSKGSCDNKDYFARYVKIDDVLVYGICEKASVF